MIVENEYVWRSLNNIETAALLFVDLEGVIRNINKGVTSLFGYMANEVIGMPVECLLPLDHRDPFKN